MKKVSRILGENKSSNNTSVFTVMLIVFVIISLVYQSLTYFSNTNQFRKVEEYNISECYTLWVRLPKQVPLVADPTVENTRPITVWGEMNSAEGDCQEKPSQLQVDFLDGQKLGFIEIDNPSPDASVLLTFGDNAAESEREQLFIYAPLSSDIPDIVTLKIKVHSPECEEKNKKKCEEKVDLPEETMDLPMQIFLVAWLQRFANIVFGIPTVTLVAAIGTLVKIYFELNEQRKEDIKEFQKNIEELKGKQDELGEYVVELLPDAQRLGEQYRQTLLNQFDRHKKSMEWGNAWSKSLRQNIINMISQKDRDFNFGEKLQEYEKNLDFLGESEIKALENFFSWYQGDKNYGSIEEKTLKNILATFQILGIDSSRLLLGGIKASIFKDDEIKFDEAQINKFIKCWDEEGKASGRYLLDRLSSDLNKPDLIGKIAIHRKGKPTPPNTLKEPYKLWPDNLRFRIPGSAPYKDVWQQPFGPLKAEDDPRLPPARFTKGDPAAFASNMFFSAKNLDWGKSILKPEPAFYTCGPGMGKTTFIWMGRHQRRYWGEKPSLSIYMHLSGIANKEKLWGEVETAVGKSLLANFVEDPYWLLDAPHKTQERVQRLSDFVGWNVLCSIENI